MRSRVLATGIILVIVGILIFILSIFDVPYTFLGMVEVPKTDVVVDESFVVQPLSHLAKSTTFYVDYLVQITFIVTEGGAGGIDFYVMDEVDYWKFRADESFQAYSAPTMPDVSSLNVMWEPPKNTTIFFVWDNPFTTYKAISANIVGTYSEFEEQVITEARTLLPSEASYLGIALLICGLPIIGYGFAGTSQKKEEHLDRSFPKND